MPSENQIRLTVPSWIANLKGWNRNTNLEVVPVVKLDNSPVDKKTQFTIKEVKFNGQGKDNKLGRKK